MSATSAVGGTNSLSPADFASSMFKKMDTDSDGKVSKSDFETANSANGMTTEQADDLFSKIDADGDGTITESENSSFASRRADKANSRV